jgi:hypothetical protein
LFGAFSSEAAKLTATEKTGHAYSPFSAVSVSATDSSATSSSKSSLSLLSRLEL